MTIQRHRTSMCVVVRTAAEHWSSSRVRRVPRQNSQRFPPAAPIVQQGQGQGLWFRDPGAEQAIRAEPRQLRSSHPAIRPQKWLAWRRAEMSPLWLRAPAQSSNDRPWKPLMKKLPAVGNCFRTARCNLFHNDEDLFERTGADRDRANRAALCGRRSAATAPSFVPRLRGMVPRYAMPATA
jgi:hypothetical protein